jgi:predicted ester cyclase
MPDTQHSTAETTVFRMYEAMNTGDERLIDEVASEVLAPDWENSPLAPGASPGADSFRNFVPWLRSVFPDFTITHEDVVACGDRVAVRSISRGTHSGGEFMGIAPTGRQVEYRAYDFHQLEDGRIKHSWHLEDFFTAVQQVGATITNPS